MRNFSFPSLVKQEYTGYIATENLVFYVSSEAGVHREDSNSEHNCIMPVSFEAMGHSSLCFEQEYTEYTTNGNLVVVCLCQMTQLGIPASIQNRGTQIPRQLRPKLYYACVIWSNGIFQHLL